MKPDMDSWLACGRARIQVPVSTAWRLRGIIGHGIAYKWMRRFPRGVVWSPLVLHLIAWTRASTSWSLTLVDLYVEVGHM